MIYDLLLFIAAFMSILSFYSDIIYRTYYGKEVRLISLKGIIISLIGIVLSTIFAITICKVL